MHNLRRTLEQRWSFQQATVMHFVDFASAFDSVGRDSLWRIVAVDGMPLRLIRAYYSSTKMKIWACGSDSLSFKIRSGVQQGCALSLTIFNYIIDWILGQALQDYPGIQVGAYVHVSDLTYADVTVMLSSSNSEMQGCLKLLIATPPHEACAIKPRRPR